jgi:hypothetical protein
LHVLSALPRTETPLRGTDVFTAEACLCACMSMLLSAMMFSGSTRRSCSITSRTAASRVFKCPLAAAPQHISRQGHRRVGGFDRIRACPKYHSAMIYRPTAWSPILAHRKIVVTLQIRALPLNEATLVLLSWHSAVYSPPTIPLLLDVSRSIPKISIQ